MSKDDYRVKKEKYINDWYTPEASPQNVALFLTHLAVWYEIIERNLESAIVFEEGIDFDGKLDEKLSSEFLNLRTWPDLLLLGILR